jgi:hypothetical protein
MMCTISTRIARTGGRLSLAKSESGVRRVVATVLYVYRELQSHITLPHELTHTMFCRFAYSLMLRGCDFGHVAAAYFACARQIFHLATTTRAALSSPGTLV